MYSMYVFSHFPYDELTEKLLKKIKLSKKLHVNDISKILHALMLMQKYDH